MGEVEAIYNQFVIYNRAWWSEGILPTGQVIQEFSNRINDLAVVKEYCTSVNVVEMIKANIPFEQLREYCTFPTGLDEQMARKFI